MIWLRAILLAFAAVSAPTRASTLLLASASYCSNLADTCFCNLAKGTPENTFACIQLQQDKPAGHQFTSDSALPANRVWYGDTCCSYPIPSTTMATSNKPKQTLSKRNLEPSAISDASSSKRKAAMATVKGSTVLSSEWPTTQNRQEIDVSEVKEASKRKAAMETVKASTVLSSEFPAVQSRQEIDVSEVKEASSCTTVCGVITTLSPIKVSTKNSQLKYFDGEICDGKKSIRIVSFNSRLRDEMEKAHQEKAPLAVVDCQVKSASRFSKDSSGFEVVVSNHTKIKNAQKEYDLPDELFVHDSTPQHLQEINEIDDISVNTKVTVTVKVIDVGEPTTVHRKDNQKPLQHQDCIVADATGSCRVVLWQDDMNKFKLNNSYKLNNVTVRLFDGRKYLSVPSDSVIEGIANIGEVDNSEIMPSIQAKSFAGEIVGVLSVDIYRSCLNCSSKLAGETKAIKCTKCGAFMRSDRCPLSATAKLLIEADDGIQY